TSGVCTASSSFSMSGTGTRVPVNYCTGPGNATFNLRFSKTIGFGRETKSASGGMGPGSGGPRGGPRGGGGLGPGGLSGGGGTMVFGPGNARNRRYKLTFSTSAPNLPN